jgi:hypothetical protein
VLNERGTQPLATGKESSDVSHAENAWFVREGFTRPTN